MDSNHAPFSVKLLRALASTQALAFTAGMVVGSAPAIVQLVIIHVSELELLQRQAGPLDATDAHPATDPSDSQLQPTSKEH